MFKIGDTTIKQGTAAYIYELSPDGRIYGRYLLGDSWVPGVWHPGGLFVGPGFPSQKDLVPNDAPLAAKKLLAYISSSGMVRYALEGSMESDYYDKDALGMKRAPKFDLLERDV